MGTPADTGATEPQPASFPKYCWQVQAGRGQSWTDYGEVETQRLEAAWTTQVWSTTEVSVILHGIAGWENYVFYLGDRLQQVNTVTSKARNMRRLVVLQQSLARSTAPLPQPEPLPEEEEDSQRSEVF